jgi:hypothetical protein
MEEWLRKGIEDWKKNMMIKKERERKSLEFTYKETQKYQNFTMTKINEATNEVLHGIDEFEENLRRQGINPHIDSDEEANQ